MLYKETPPSFMKYQSLLFFTFFTINILPAQINMNKGFKLLENGSFKEAKLFFKNTLNEYPNNKTAKLCYGRALGLSGNPEKATTIFTNLLKKYPNDFEIQLNYAESLLWNKQYNEAKVYYKKLIIKNDNSFPATLGYANTLSNLKEYKEALVFIDKALTLSNGNKNALLSKKYIRLGYAYKIQQQEEYKKAILLLDQNLKDFKNDSETLVSKANIYVLMKEFDKAEKTYKNLNTTNRDSILSLNGLALVSHLQNDDKKALKLSKNAIDRLSTAIDDKILKKETIERYIQALIWNKKYTQAEKEIKKLQENNTSADWITALGASLNMYKGNYKKSVNFYNSILKSSPNSFDGNLGIANAYFANDAFRDSYKATEKTLKIFPNQKDAVSLLKKLDQKFTPFVEEIVNYSFDNGDNTAITSNTKISLPINTRLSINPSFEYRKTDNKTTQNSATATSLSVGITYQLFSNIALETNITYQNVNATLNDYQQFLGAFRLKLKPYVKQNLVLGFQRKLENFNAELLGRQIIGNDYFVSYSINSNINLGWFGQYFFTSQSDGNTRNLLFSSLYYSILEKPTLKTGLNYQFISFKNQVPTIYFSPDIFNSAELFLQLTKDENSVQKKQWFYDLNGAVGYQFITNESKQLTYRVQSKLGYKFSDRFVANIFNQYTNLASATASGFTFTEIGLRLRWNFFKAPIFKRPQ